MSREWNDIKWIFEPDGSCRDIYVQDISIREWEILIDHLNENFDLEYSGVDNIDKKYIIEFLQDSTGDMERVPVTINLRHIKANCYFFLAEQIEFDIDPKEVNSLSDFELIESFMTSISEVLHEQVTLTQENTPEFPLFKVDSKNRVNKILTEEEVDKLRRTKNSIFNQLIYLKTKLKMKFFPKLFKKQLLESASQVYKPTKKEKNVW